MHNPFTSFESRLKIYRRVWMVAVAVVIVLRFTLCLYLPPQSRFNVFLAFVLGTWLPLMFVNIFESQRLRNHFAAYHGSPRDLFLGIRIFTWFVSGNDNGDPKLEIFRQERLRFRRFAVTVFFTNPVIFIIFAL